MITGILFLISSCRCMKVKDDVRRVWSVKFHECRCQSYSAKELRPISKLIPCEDYFEEVRTKRKIRRKCRKKVFANNNPELCYQLPNEQYCDDLVGFSAKSWAKNITPKGRETKACYEDSCGR